MSADNEFSLSDRSRLSLTNSGATGPGRTGDETKLNFEFVTGMTEFSPERRHALGILPTEPVSAGVHAPPSAPPSFLVRGMSFA